MIEAYTPEHAHAWDELVGVAPMATLLHTRRYLSYHENRFDDASLMLRNDSGELVGVLPAAVDPDEDRRVVSHPGVTYGGIIHDGALQGERMLEALKAVRRHYAEAGFSSLCYKAVPHIYHRRPSADDLYALFRLDATRYRVDLSCAIDVLDRRKPGSRRRRGANKARKEGTQVSEGFEAAPAFWPVLRDNLRRRHHVTPVHTLEEIQLLQGRFPDEIRLAVARREEQVVAGTVMFMTARVLHAQYIGSSEDGMAIGALDLVFEHCIARADELGRRYFDFGISTVDGGRALNAGLHQYKWEFGGGGVAYEFYDLPLS